MRDDWGMTTPFAERLTALDASFLDIETRGSHMDIGALAILEKGELRTADGGIDFPRIERLVEVNLSKVPRHRQRLVRVPVLAQPYWVDDAQFRLSYHVRHTALPRPGSERQLKRLTGRIFSQRLDPDRPLWELWVVEGLEGERFAMVLKAHHCLADGIAGAGILLELFMAEEREPPSWTPRPAPSPRALIEMELRHRAGGWRKLTGGLRAAAADPRSSLRNAREVVHGAVDTLAAGVTQARSTSLNPRHVGPHRRFDTCRMDLEELKEVKRRLGGKLNDVVLAVATGALHAFLRRREGTHDRDVAFRALVPVSTRGKDGGLGNRVALMLVSLPIDAEEPLERYRLVREATDHAKLESGHASASELFEDVANWTATTLVADLLKLAMTRRSFNVVITNVPGPPFELSLLGAPLSAIYPRVPLYENQALGIALLSYHGGMYWGLNADWSRVDDLHVLASALDASFAELLGAARGA
jgi:WS/DGAT/MGAT family acyltransferase